MKQQSFTRKEVTALLKAQVAKSANSYGKMQFNLDLRYNKAVLDEIVSTGKRLRKVTLVKY